jgi:maleylacetoacetate isomerase
MTTPQASLYHYFRSSCSWRVRWALQIKGIPFTAVAVDLLKGEQQREDYLAKNPMGAVPALTLAEGYLTESIAILEYLDEVHPRPPLLPSDPLARARVRQLVQLIAADTQPVQNIGVLRHIARLQAGPEAQREAQKEWAQHYISRGLGAYEALLQQPGWPRGRYSYGDELTMADLCLIPQCYNGRRQGMDLGRWPRVAAIEAAALASPHAQTSHPDAYAP